MADIWLVSMPVFLGVQIGALLRFVSLGTNELSRTEYLKMLVKFNYELPILHWKLDRKNKKLCKHLIRLVIDLPSVIIGFYETYTQALIVKYMITKDSLDIDLNSVDSDLFKVYYEYEGKRVLYKDLYYIVKSQ